MLRRWILVITAVWSLGLLSWFGGASVAAADQSNGTSGDVTNYDGGGVEVTISDEHAGPLPPHQDSNTTGKSTLPKCYYIETRDIVQLNLNTGEPEDTIAVDCEFAGRTWYNSLQKYCRPVYYAPDNPIWNKYRDGDGKPTGGFFNCLSYGRSELTDGEDWYPISLEGSNPVNYEAVVLSSVASIQLQQPSTGVGAFVYPDYPDWGLTWWVGAPMWLWTDTANDHQWGSHTLTAAIPGASITAHISATTLSVDPGDGSPAVVCHNPGSPRPWNPDQDYIANHSPANCEHVYEQTSTLGDPTSCFVVTASVTWVVDWQATTGQAGRFSFALPSEDPVCVHVGAIHVVNLVPPR